MTMKLFHKRPSLEAYYERHIFCDFSLDVTRTTCRYKVLVSYELETTYLVSGEGIYI